MSILFRLESSKMNYRCLTNTTIWTVLCLSTFSFWTTASKKSAKTDLINIRKNQEYVTLKNAKMRAMDQLRLSVVFSKTLLYYLTNNQISTTITKFLYSIGLQLSEPMCTEAIGMLFSFCNNQFIFCFLISCCVESFILNDLRICK